MPASFRILLFLLASWAVLFACTPQELADSNSAKPDSEQVPGKDDPQQPDDPQDPEPEDPQDPEEPGDDPVPPDPQPPVDVPVADLLDVVFQSDGTAVDVSASRMSVQTIAGAQLSTAYNANYKRYAALFTHDMGKETASGYYKIDYSSNTDFQNRIADSHTWEAIVRIDQDPANAGEVKFFSTQEWGGTGFLVSSAQSRNNAFTFLVNTGAWNWAESSIVPAVGRYYHLVGVFDAASSKAELYVDGVCRASVTTTSSTYNPARETCRYVVIGGDPGGAGCSNAWNGAVVLARIYDKAVTADEARLLYEREKSDIPQADVQFLRECIVSPGMKYTIFGSGFKSSDFINIVNKSTAATTRLDGTATSEGFTLTIPASLQAGDYNLVLSRDGWTTLLGSVRFILATAPRAAKTKVVAHRGAFKETGLPENSVAALRAAASMGVYASEMDVWITADDVVVVNHNDSYPTDPNSRYITDTKYTDMGNIRLGNGEPVPTFDEYVRVARECGIRLVVEIKTQRASADNSHTKAENNQRVVDAAIAIVKKYDYESMCDWIAFSFDNCKRIVSKLPNATVQYLNGDKSPAECLAAGIKGIDYHTSTLSLEWAQSAHSQGMLVNVWTVDGTTNLMKYIGWGVDYLTTNSPREAQALCEMNFLTNLFSAPSPIRSARLAYRENICTFVNMTGNTGNGEMINFNRVFVENYKDLCMLAFRYVKSVEVSEDVVQDVFCKMLVRRPDLFLREDLSSIRAYLWRSVRNKAIDWQRVYGGSSVSLEEQTVTDELDRAVEKLVAKDEQGGVSYDLSILTEAVEAALSELPPRAREVYRLRREEELSNKEVARRLGVSVKAVEKQMTLALKRIRIKINRVKL